MSDTGRRRYEKNPTSFVTAVQLDLDTDGFTYRKWGHGQRCKRGDWLVKHRTTSQATTSSPIAWTARTPTA